MIFTFGKYKGCQVSEIAKSDMCYLQWVASNCTKITPALKREIDAYVGGSIDTKDAEITALKEKIASLERRLRQLERERDQQYANGCKCIASLVKTRMSEWRRLMAIQYHPDRRSGSNEAMIVVNVAYDNVLKLVEGAT